MTYVFISIASFIAGFVQTISGFAAGIILSLFNNTVFDAVVSTTLTNMICVILSPIILIPYIKKIKWKYVVLPWVFYLPFSTFFITRLKSINVGSLKLAFGIFLVVLSIYFLIFASKIKIKPNILIIILFSAVSGTCQALFAVGGPLMALYFSAVIEDKEEYIASTQMFFAVTSGMGLFTRIQQGLVTSDLWMYAFIGWAFLIAGRLIAKKVFDKINALTLKRIVYIVMLFSGVINVLSQIM